MNAGLRLARFGLVAAQAGIVAVSIYQSLITAFGYARRARARARKPEAPPSPVRFGLIVCARNEEHVVDRVVRDLQAQEYPRELFDIIVVAHNCTDDTASVAARAGAFVMTHNTTQPGKARAVEAGITAFGGNEDFLGIFDADAGSNPACSPPSRPTLVRTTACRRRPYRSRTRVAGRRLWLRPQGQEPVLVAAP